VFLYLLSIYEIMENKFEKQLKRLRALSDEERMERVKALAKAWREYETRRSSESM